MKLLTPQKQVNFHGIMVWGPEWTRFMAADEDGDISLFEVEPEQHEEGFYQNLEFGNFSWLPTYRVDLEGKDWRDTLVEVE